MRYNLKYLLVLPVLLAFFFVGRASMVEPSDYPDSPLVLVNAVVVDVKSNFAVIDHGADSSLAIGDRVAFYRKRIKISDGMVVKIVDNQSVVNVVGGGPVQSGDRLQVLKAID